MFEVEEHHHPLRMLAQSLQRRLAIRGVVDGIAGLVEEVADRLADGRVVIHHEHLCQSRLLAHRR